MHRFLNRLLATGTTLNPAGASALSLFARIVFALVLLPFFLISAATKIDGFGLAAGAYVQILPQVMEAVAYDPSKLGWPLHLIVLAGTLAEFTLPLAVVVGLATRPAAAAMIGFIVVMSLTDIYGHGIDAATAGALLDADPYALVIDARLMWTFLLVTLTVVGGGRVSADALILSRLRARSLA